MSYTITSYSRSKAKKLGVIIKKSKNKKKKLDVFKEVKTKDGKKELKLVAQVGQVGYGDFPTFKKEKGLEFAKKRRKAYKARHEKNRHKLNTPSYYADQLLW